MRVKLNKHPTVKVEIIDDAESTPGMSRQISRFNSQVKGALKKILVGNAYEKHNVYSISLLLSDVLKAYNFKLVSLSLLNNRNVEIEIESTEK